MSDLDISRRKVEPLKTKKMYNKDFALDAEISGFIAEKMDRNLTNKLAKKV